MITGANQNRATNFKSWTPNAQQLLIKNANKLSNTNIETIERIHKNPGLIYDLMYTNNPGEVMLSYKNSESKTTMDYYRDTLEGHFDLLDIAEGTPEQPNTLNLSEKLRMLTEIFATKPEK